MSGPRNRLRGRITALVLSLYGLAAISGFGLHVLAGEDHDHHVEACDGPASAHFDAAPDAEEHCLVCQFHSTGQHAGPAYRLTFVNRVADRASAQTISSPPAPSWQCPGSRAPPIG